MESKLIRIVPDEVGQSWGDWTAQGVHKTLSLGLFKRFAPTKDQIKSAGSTVADVAGDLVRLVHKNGSDQIQDIAASRACTLSDVDGHRLSQEVIYAEHPIVSEAYIKADSLHDFLLKEQRAQIIRYFRSTVALKSLTIEIVSQSTGKFYAGGSWKVARLDGQKDSHSDNRHWFTATYTDPQVQSCSGSENLFWMPYFDEIVAATKGASGGTIETATVLNTSYGISIEAAKMANIDRNWISQQSFLVKAEYV